MSQEPQTTDEELDKEFEALLADYLPENTNKRTGELIDVTVVGIVDDSVLVSYGSKEESPIPLREFLDPKGEPTVKPGDQVRVLLAGYDQGVAQLSYDKARAAIAEKMIEEAHDAGRPVRGVISRVVKGGVLVDVGMPAFMPASQVDLYRVGDMEAFVGREVEAYVIDYDPSRKRAVLSRRRLLEERKEAGQKEFFDNVTPGQTVTGTVKDVLDFGVFVQIGDVEALIPRSELSYDRAANPTEIVTPGQTIEAKVIDLAPETGKITLSRKRLHQDPWDTIEERYPAGQAVKGTIVGVQPFGAFVQLEEGITGLIHITDASWDQDKKSPEDYFREGDNVTCQVVEIDKEKKRLSLSLKHLMRDPWSDIEERFPVGSRQKGTVSSVRDFGLFVKLDESAEGLLHISELSWKKRFDSAKDAGFKEGDEIEVRVLKFDQNQRRISLGHKQLESSPLAKFREENKVGSVVKGKVTRLAPFGAFVELAEGLEGLIHISELDEHRVDSPERVVKVDDEVNVKVLGIDEKRDRISLSRRQAFRELERQNIKEFQRQARAQEKEMGGGFGDLLSDALKKK